MNEKDVSKRAVIICHDYPLHKGKWMQIEDHLNSRYPEYYTVGMFRTDPETEQDEKAGENIVNLYHAVSEWYDSLEGWDNLGNKPALYCPICGYQILGDRGKWMEQSSHTSKCFVPALLRVGE